MAEFDPGPPPQFAELFARMPDYAPLQDCFWFDWGPIFYRGRLDGSGRVLVVASDPGPTERIALRTMVGDAGQRVQGFLTKLGLTRSYICVNAYAYALLPSKSRKAAQLLQRADHIEWRNQIFDLLAGPQLQAVVAFGLNAQKAVANWPGAANFTVANIPHPSSDNVPVLLERWREAITNLRAIVTPDPDGDPTLPNYGATFTESDYGRVPACDLPFGVPDWLGDDAWGRSAKPRHFNCVRRPPEDDRHTLIWIAPVSAPV